MEFPRTIYAIQHNETKRIYIGSTKNVETRYQSHIGALRRGKHTVEDMQEDFDKYGENYSLFILEEIKEFKDKIKEYEWMRKYKTMERSTGYNYKDKASAMRFLQNYPPYAEGLPSTANVVTKEDLHELIETLTESQIVYVHTLVSMMFKEERK